MKLTILAVTRMQEKRICIAGINEEGKWVRPVKDYPGHFEEADISSKEGSIIYKNFNIVEIDFTKKLDNPPHSEDHVINESKEPKVVGDVPSEKRGQFLNSHTENNFFANHEGEPVRKVLQEANRSLILIGPVNIRCVVFKKDKGPKVLYDLPGINIESRYTPCTDFKLRSLSKRVLKENDELVMNWTQLKEELKIEKVFLAIGLARWWEEKKDYYDMIIGMHTIPDYQTEIDYNKL